jgi:RNA polymerase sigma-70 factor, ECF subfamily
MNIDLCEIRLLIRFATQRTGRPIHDEDLVQDATLKAVEAFRKPFEIRYPRAFLRKIVGDTVRDHWRRRRAQEDLTTIDEEDLSESPCFEENLDMQRRIDCLRRGLAQLDEGKRATLVLFYVEERSVSEIACLQQKSISAVKMELLRARRLLARIVRNLSRSRSTRGAQPGNVEAVFRGTISHHESRAIPADAGSIGCSNHHAASGDVRQVFNSQPNQGGSESKRNGHAQCDERIQNQS